MSTEVIRGLLEARLKTWADAQTPAMPVAWQNVAFTPPQDKKYLRCFVLPGRTTSDDLKGDHRGYRGVFQVSIVRPLGEGTGFARAIEVQLDALYPVNLRLGTSLAVQILTPMSASNPIDEPEAIVFPVTARYQADAI